MNHNSKANSKASLFLMEQVIVLAVFAACAAVCIYILIFSYQTAVDAADAKNALFVAESAAESHKAVASVLPGGAVYVYYDNNWQISNKENASFVLSIIGRQAEHVGLADISVSKIIGGELISLTAARRVGEV